MEGRLTIVMVVVVVAQEDILAVAEMVEQMRTDEVMLGMEEEGEGGEVELD